MRRGLVDAGGCLAGLDSRGLELVHAPLGHLLFLFGLRVLGGSELLTYELGPPRVYRFALPIYSLLPFYYGLCPHNGVAFPSRTPSESLTPLDFSTFVSCRLVY